MPSYQPYPLSRWPPKGSFSLGSPRLLGLVMTMLWATTDTDSWLYYSPFSQGLKIKAVSPTTDQCCFQEEICILQEPSGDSPLSPSCLKTWGLKWKVAVWQRAALHCASYTGSVHSPRLRPLLATIPGQLTFSKSLVKNSSCPSFLSTISCRNRHTERLSRSPGYVDAHGRTNVSWPPGPRNP